MLDTLSFFQYGIRRRIDFKYYELSLLFMNAIIVATISLVMLTYLRLNVISAIIVSSFVGGLIGGLEMSFIWSKFLFGLDRGSELALGYAMIGGFACLISKSGFTHYLNERLISSTKKTKNSIGARKKILLSVLVMSFLSQNLIPVHVAFIPILIPMLLPTIQGLKTDKRLISCILSFGLVAPYMFLPVGFGHIFLNDILLQQVSLHTSDTKVLHITSIMMWPFIGMCLGLMIAFKFSYQKERQYSAIKNSAQKDKIKFSKRDIALCLSAIFVFFISQLSTNSIALSSILASMVMGIGSKKRWVEANTAFDSGVKMIVSIGIIIMSANGFAEVLKETGHISSLVNAVQGNGCGDQGCSFSLLRKCLYIVAMLIIGLIVTFAIGSSFSTVPLLAAIYVPICLQIGLSLDATICIIGTAAVLGDTGSPISEVTLVTTANLKKENDHDHFRDTVLPTFLHFNIPLIIFGVIGALYL